MRNFLTLAAFLFLNVAAVSQTSIWYVDPVNGDNGNTGSTALDPFLSIRVALINSSLSSGDTILLAGGTLTILLELLPETKMRCFQSKFPLA